MDVKSLVSMNSRTPFMLRSPARIQNCPVGDQKMWFAVFRSYFFNSSGPCHSQV